MILLTMVMMTVWATMTIKYNDHDYDDENDDGAADDGDYNEYCW